MNSVSRGGSPGIIAKPLAANRSPNAFNRGTMAWQVAHVVRYFRAKAGMRPSAGRGAAASARRARSSEAVVRMWVLRR